MIATATATLPRPAAVLHPPARPLLIALTSPAMGSGKSTVAEHLVARHGFTLVKFAGPLKDMVRTMLTTGLALDRATIERMVEGDLKEQPVDGLDVTPRHMLQTLGTEWGRNCVRADLWIQLARLKVRAMQAFGRSVVIDDMRFPNELDMVRALDGHPVRIVRRGAAITTAHVSEGQLDAVPLRELRNDDSVEDLLARIDRLVNNLR